MSIYQNNFVFEKHNQSFSDYIGLCIKHHKDEKGTNTEFHHIFPEHKGGTNDRWNKVHLEYELHVEAHRLLMEAFPEDKSMKSAYNRTRNRGSNRGEGNPMHGVESPNKGKTGENSSRFGKEPWNKELPPEEQPMFGRTGDKHPMFGKEPWNKGKPSPKIKCEHCGREIDYRNFHKYHGPKCKMNPNK